MAFDDVVFPYYPMKHDSTKSVSDPVAVNTNGTYEYRLKRTRFEKYTWGLTTQTMTLTQKEEIKGFLLSRGHALNSFKFVDADEPEFVDASLSHISGDLWNLALPIDSSTPGTHPIFNPDIGNMTVTVNGGAGVIAGFSVTNGIPTLQVTGTTGSEVVKVSGPIHFTVRLNTDFKYALIALDQNNKSLGFSVNEIQLTEVFGEY